MDSHSGVSKCAMVTRITYASIGLFVGLLAGVWFWLDFKNYDASAFGFFSGIWACATLIVHILWKQGVWSYQNHSHLTGLMYTGCFVQLIGVCSFVTYIVLGSIYQTDHFMVYDRSYFITCVWCFMTWKWGFALFYYSRSYRREITKVETMSAF